MQSVADEHLSAEDQEIYIAYVQRRMTLAQLAQSRGQAWAEDFVDRMTTFASASSAQCGVP